MGTNIGSEHGKTPGKVKKYVPFVGAAFGREREILYFSWCFSLFGPYFGTYCGNLRKLSVPRVYPGGYSGAFRSCEPLRAPRTAPYATISIRRSEREVATGEHFLGGALVCWRSLHGDC